MLCVAAAQKRMNLSPKQLGALMQTRRRLLTDIGTLLAEREQLAAKIRVRGICCYFALPHSHDLLLAPGSASSWPPTSRCAARALTGPSSLPSRTAAVGACHTGHTTHL